MQWRAVWPFTVVTVIRQHEGEEEEVYATVEEEEYNAIYG